MCVRYEERPGFRSLFDGYLLLLAILLVQSFLDLRAYRREKQTGLRNQLIIEVHFAFSLIAMLFAHLLMYKWWKEANIS